MMEALEAERRLFGDTSIEVASRYAAPGYFYAQTCRTGEAMGWLDPAASQVEAAMQRRDRELGRELVLWALTLSEPVSGYGSAKVRKIRELAESRGTGFKRSTAEALWHDLGPPQRSALFGDLRLDLQHVCEGSHSLLHRDVLWARGSGFSTILFADVINNG